MSATTEALELVKLLKPKIGEQAATKLIDYADKKQTGEIEFLSKSTDRLWVAIAILAGLLVMSIGLMTYFHGDTKSDMQELESRMDKRFDKLEKLIIQKR